MRLPEPTGRGTTLVVTVDVLLPGFESGVLVEVMVAVFALGPRTAGKVTFTVIVQATLAPAVRPALVQVTVPALCVQSLLADTNVVPAGSASVTVKPALSDGPRLSTVSV
jgi:hypothetical protein